MLACGLALAGCDKEDNGGDGPEPTPPTPEKPMPTPPSTETATISYTYAQNAVKAYGKGKKEDIDVAMCINDPKYAGMKLTGIRAYISTAEGISNTSVWISKQLQLENKMNVPDIDSWSVTPATVAEGGQTFAVLDMNLPEAYTLTTDPLYIGYSITVDDNTTEEQRFPVIYSEGPNPNGLFIHMSKSVLKWTEYSNQVGGVAYIVARLESDFLNYALNVESAEPIYAENEKDFQASFNVANVGANPITSVKYSYSVDGGEDVEMSKELALPLQTNLVSTDPISLDFKGVSGVGKHSLLVKVTEVNGVENRAEKVSITCDLNVIPFVPVNRPLVEEFTGLWCGNCPRGFVAMEYIGEHYPDEAVVVCYHNGDPMQVTTNYPVPVTAFPQASINREYIMDPYWGTYTEFGKEMTILRNLQSYMDSFTIADINVTAELSGTSVNATANVVFIEDMDATDYEVGYVLVQNGIYNEGWGQDNYYSGQRGWEGTELEWFTQQPSPTKGLVFNDVAVDVKGMMGVAGSVPATVKAGEWYTHNYTFNIDGNSLVYDTANLVVVAYVVNKSTGMVLNSNKFAFK